MAKVKKPLLLVILDGWGLGDDTDDNTVAKALLPSYQRMWSEFPHTSLIASGEEVGLPAGQMGNSEVGHLNMGAGRVVYQDLTRISRGVRTGSFFENPVMVSALEYAHHSGQAVHLMGLLSDGGVHSHLSHLFALLKMAKERGLSRVYIHAFLDGRDVPPASAKTYVETTEDYCRQLGLGRIATVMGRYYAMDRDKRWDRVAKAFSAMVSGAGEKAPSAMAAVEQSYRQAITDEFVIPTVVTGENGTPAGVVRPGDQVIFFNFRADRARELTRAFVEPDFTAFDRPVGWQGTPFVCMTQYDATIPAPAAYPPEDLKNTLGEVLSRQGLHQLRIAETEKYAHVTFFFNGGVEEPNRGEERLLIPSPKVATYDQQPEMSAIQVTAAVLEQIRSRKYDVIILNFANPDMVGHTGLRKAVLKAVETVDLCLGRIQQAVEETGGTLIVTADHGNAEQMVDPTTGEPHTAHTSNPVPLILIDQDYKGVKLREGGALEDIAPTVLDLLNTAKPAEMTGTSLIIH